MVWNKNISVKVKKILFNALVKSRLLYVGNVWWPNKHQLGKLETVQNDFVRWVSGVRRQDRLSARKLRKEVGLASLEDCLCIKRLDWLGWLISMDRARLVSRVWGAKCDGKRAKGRPRWIFA